VNVTGTVTAVLMYQYWGLPPGCASGDTPQLACTPNGSGVFAVSVAVTDGIGDNATANLTLTVNPALSADPIADPAFADVSEPVRFSAGATGGQGPYSYSWRFGDGAGSANASPTHAYAAAGTFTAFVWVNDSGGGAIVRSTVISVTAGPEVSLVAVDPRPPVGSTLELNASVSGGRAPYTYSYTGLPPDCASVDSPTLRCLLIKAGLYTASVGVTDARGARTNGSASVVVGFGFSLLLPAVVTLGENFTIQVLEDGNYGPVTFGYAGLPAGCAASMGSEVNCSPQRLGTFDVTVTMNDSLGDQASRTEQVDVVASATAPLGFSSEILLAEVAVSLLALGGILITWSKRVHRSPDVVPEPARTQEAVVRDPPPGAFGPSGPPKTP
jgi:hypothetical protein